MINAALTISRRAMRTLGSLSLAAATIGAQGRDTVRVDVDHGSRVWIEGSSNIRDWACRASTFDGRIELDGAARDDAAIADRIRQVNVKLSARDLKCGNRRMENDLYAALKATDPAAPSYIIGRFEASAGGDASELHTRGTIAVAGVEKNVAVKITTERLADGSVRARGSVPLLMTDFGVKPPVGMLGLIRSRNEVVVKFELIIGARALRP